MDSTRARVVQQAGTPINGGQVADTNTTPPIVGSVVMRIEHILETIVDALESKEQLTIDFVSKRHSRSSENRREKICFPGRTAREARKFSTKLMSD